MPNTKTFVVAMSGALLMAGCLSAFAQDDAKIIRSPDGWIVKIDGSEFTENKNVIALKIDRAITTGLALRCFDHKKSVSLRHYDATYGPDKTYVMQLRVGSGAVETFTGRAVNNRTLQILEGEKFLDQVMGAKSFAPRLDTGDGLIEEIKFKSSDMRHALKPLLDECPVVLKQVGLTP
jgi:hypothetical protein